METELDIDQFRMDKSKPDLVDGKVIVVGYDSQGCPTQNDSAFCVTKAAWEKSTNSLRYYIRQCMYGLNRSRFYDPQSADPGDLTKNISHVGSKLYEFREVSQGAFDFYMAYLKSGNTSYLRNAERA